MPSQEKNEYAPRSNRRNRVLMYIMLGVLISLGGYIAWDQFINQSAVNTEEDRNADTVSDDATEGVFITEGVRHSVPLDEIVGGGPQKDGIPSIDDPQFESVAAASEWLSAEDTGIAVTRGDVHRFYPYQILVYHEIVNDTIDGERILVTYCPLCLSGAVFDPLVDGERVEFGVSGKLWNSNLVMYDRKTDSLWSQALGKAIVGDQTGASLELMQFDQLQFGDWADAYPTGEVLSRDTGATEFYGHDPYGDYYVTPGILYPVENQDNRLEGKELILGLTIDGQAKAYVPSAVKEVGVLEDVLAGRDIIAEYDEDIDAVRFYEVTEDGGKERLNPFPMFWFSWVAIHPDTALYDGA